MTVNKYFVRLLFHNSSLYCEGPKILRDFSLPSWCIRGPRLSGMFSNVCW